MTVVEAVRTPHRTVWGDARFFLGILLILASVAGVWFVVAAARQTTPVIAATRTLVPGEVISSADVRAVDVALGQVGDAYLAPDALSEGMVATRVIESGELVPAASIGDASSVHTTTVVVRSGADVPASVDAGSVVELWAAPLVERGVYDTPRVLVADATVISVTRDDSAIGGGSAALELVIPRSEVAATLAALADESALSVVPGGNGS